MYYVLSNAQVIQETINILHLPGTVYDYVIDRQNRRITYDRNGVVWPIPESINLR